MLNIFIKNSSDTKNSKIFHVSFGNSLNDVLDKPANWHEKIPVNINNNGDPLINNQVENTVSKIKSLEDFANIYHVCTKAVPSERAFQLLESLTPKQKKNSFISYSLTGLNEGHFSFENRVDVIKRLHDIFNDTTILLRPLIKGLNDSKENIERIVNVAADYGNKIIMGGLHSDELIKQLDPRTEDYFADACSDHGVQIYNKTTCAVADKFDASCKVHDVDGKVPKNVEVLNLLGYKYDMEHGKIILNQASSGDMNLVRFITDSLPYTKKLISRLNKISTLGEHNYELTSGWLSWSENKPCNIGCNYCVMSQIDYLKDRSSVGSHPKELQNIRIDTTPKPAIKVNTLNKYISYKDIRKQVPCLRVKI